MKNYYYFKKTSRIILNTIIIKKIGVEDLILRLRLEKNNKLSEKKIIFLPFKSKYYKTNRKVLQQEESYCEGKRNFQKKLMVNAFDINDMIQANVEKRNSDSSIISILFDQV